ncbi:ankyrin repeat domain-containing protein [Paenibacillus ehimensis]|uniref:ankyrin repeat domain-containing protein n=1 Tax=Paenibacillus ehimensis TaxID=79264 RepID=UPI000FDB8605|nr:ankyrin repeat domain-containing protein [Paenibacillus ehimensis]MEC0208037.1 ankyrin repeat domain-containing protein [Paenibacillus ehimensis]
MTEFEKEVINCIKSNDADQVMPVLEKHGLPEGSTLPVHILNQALEYKQLALARQLLEKYVFDRLNDERNPVMPYAARYGTRDLFERLVKAGADLHALTHVKSSAIGRALAFGNHKGVRALLELGFDMRTYAGGDALRDAAWSGKFEFVKLFVEHGADVNFNGRSQVFPYCTTPVQMAASMNHFEIVKYLIEHGADVTIKDKNGDRAYSYAKQNNHKELMEYIKQFEPPIWHEMDNRAKELKRLGLPAEIIKWLGIENRRIELKDCQSSEYIEFETIFDVRVLEWRGRTFIDLVKDIDNYSNTGFIVWVKDKKCLGSLDVEHDELILLPGLKWKAFLAKAAGIIDDILDGNLSGETFED